MKTDVMELRGSLQFMTAASRTLLNVLHCSEKEMKPWMYIIHENEQQTLLKSWHEPHDLLKG